MAQEETNPAMPIWRRFITPLLIVVLLGGAIALLPRGFDTDLSQIGQGHYTVVQVFKKDTLRSQQLMDLVNEIRDQYEPRGVKFLLADVDTQPGQRFAQSHDVGSATAILFGPQGHKLQTLHNVQDATALKRALNQALAR